MAAKEGEEDQSDGKPDGGANHDFLVNGVHHEEGHQGNAANYKATAAPKLPKGLT